MDLNRASEMKRGSSKTENNNGVSLSGLFLAVQIHEEKIIRVENCARHGRRTTTIIYIRYNNIQQQQQQQLHTSTMDAVGKWNFPLYGGSWPLLLFDNWQHPIPDFPPYNVKIPHSRELRQRRILYMIFGLNGWLLILVLISFSISPIVSYDNYFQCHFQW